MNLIGILITYRSKLERTDTHSIESYHGQTIMEYLYVYLFLWFLSSIFWSFSHRDFAHFFLALYLNILEKAMAPHSNTLAWKIPWIGGAWWAAVHGVAKNRTRLINFTFTFSLSCIGEGNGNPLQCSCLENPRGRRAVWADVYGVTQSRTRLKWLSSSNANDTVVSISNSLSSLLVDMKSKDFHVLNL